MHACVCVVGENLHSRNDHSLQCMGRGCGHVPFPHHSWHLPRHASSYINAQSAAARQTSRQCSIDFTLTLSLCRISSIIRVSPTTVPNPRKPYP